MSLRAELYCRDASAQETRACQLTVLGRLQSLVAWGTLDGVRVRTWPSRVADTDTLSGPTLAVYRLFEEWATAHGVSMRPGFDVHRCRSGYTGADYTTTVLPVMALALFEDNQLVAVYPHSENGRIRSVLDGLAWLESSERPTATEPANQRPA